MAENFIKDLTLDLLRTTPVGTKLEQALSIYDKVQAAAAKLADMDDTQTLTELKVGTILTQALIGKMIMGKKLNSLSQEDWADIAGQVIDTAVLMDDKAYTSLVFDKYADYILLSAKVMEGRMKDWKKAHTDKEKEKEEKKKKKQNPHDGEKERDLFKEQIKSIKGIAKEIKHKSKLLQDNKIDEPTYVEDCLWLSLEAIVKCFSAQLSCTTGAVEYGHLMQATSMFAFEYGRYMLYKREQAILAEYLEDQYLLDEQLETRFNAFKAELEADAEVFDALINNAFAPNFRESLRGSIELARAAGVEEGEILQTEDDIDDFFLN